MKKNQLLIFAVFICALFIFNSCEKESSATDEINGIFIVPTSQSPMEEKTITLSADPSAINFAIALSRPASGMVNATLSIDNSLISSYNATYNTSYSSLPDGSVKLGVTNVTIAGGEKVSAQDSIELESSVLDPDSVYLIPVKIASVSGGGVVLKPIMGVKYYVVNLKRPDWIVVGFSSQEANGEGPNNGHVIQAFDGNPNTFWHTQWQGALPGPPHWIIIDMVAPRIINGFQFLDRQPTGDNKPKDIEISLSEDNITWTKAGSFTLEEVDVWQTVTLDNPMRARYFNLTINSTYDADTYTNLAEMKVF